METQIHIWNGLLVIVLNLGLAAVAWARARQGQAPTRALWAVQGIAHLLLTVQVLLGVGLLARGQTITAVHPLLGILALLSLLLPLVVPTLRDNRPLAAAVVPTTVTILALLAYGVGEFR
jgi:hypothetical protein